MALVVETGTGLANADSYNELADITTYNAAHQAIAAWTSASDALKERAARQATQYLEATYQNRWRGTRKTEVQALAYPREGVWLDGVLLDEDVIPKKLRDAHSELAIRAVSGPLMPDVETPGALTMKRTKAGPVEIEKRWDAGGQGQTTWLRLIDGLLSGLVFDNGELLRA